MVSLAQAFGGQAYCIADRKQDIDHLAALKSSRVNFGIEGVGRQGNLGSFRDQMYERQRLSENDIAASYNACSSLR